MAPLCFMWELFYMASCCRVWLFLLQVDACMVATGRVPNTKTLGLENMGIETNRGFVQARCSTAGTAVASLGPAAYSRYCGHKHCLVPGMS